jgi:phosphoenolpyruvate---glycerone phosphotransferase subunit DhaL
MKELKAADFKSVIHEIKTIVDKNHDFLMQLDSVMGDGDLGFTMTRAFNAAHEEALHSEESIPGKLLSRLGMVIAKASPSTMGTLVATGFMKGGKAIGEKEKIGAEELAVFFEVFVQSIMERGKSVPGNKTIIDVLYPAAKAFRESVSQQGTIDDSIAAARLASAKGLEESTMMKAQHGRAAYYQEKSIGKQDGGATVGAYIIDGFYNYIVKEPL